MGELNHTTGNIQIIPYGDNSCIRNCLDNDLSQLYSVRPLYGYLGTISRRKLMVYISQYC